ncbi:MAG: hypothetical protein DRP64_07340 [Verrucomicrobia bacterium]|nr:MAG: hypothetical protein DRP64_07340 [Verrucomicrobiota bacterium]
MPIQCRFDVEEISKNCFHEIDYRAMRHVFDIQNELGRLCHESIYQAELVHRCTSEGLSVLAEGEIVVTHASFHKSYFLDALVGKGAIYELKAVDALNGQHESQLLNYLFLAELREGKLLNFSSPSVQHRFVSTNIEPANRYSFTIDDSGWAADIPSSGKLWAIVCDLLSDWGAFLDIKLYREALFHFLGGEEQLLSFVDIFVGERIVGHQKMHLVDRETGLHISSTLRNVEAYRKQLFRILNHTSLNQIQWINFSRNEINLVTLKK